MIARESGPRATHVILDLDVEESDLPLTLGYGPGRVADVSAPDGTLRGTFRVFALLPSRGQSEPLPGTRPRTLGVVEISLQGEANAIDTIARGDRIELREVAHEGG